ncbi:transcriptional coactivator YAP1-A-like isoform X2 [Ruditapes philippinarum]|uniref:transcriptional coactivator YAP1-A-like isoform X2 n=1 Tax=Ruditapes philippinarum TaxID=129788 RepID=UPI00295BCD81|nr:transcriptional coactivator YAP1-A-like isoform X2 [Ruditapes philippinarum]
MGERTERTGTQVVHVRENSDHEMEAMFKAALNPKPGVAGIPLRQRNLPPSFFTPPDPNKQINHSREGSTDSTGYSNPGHSVLTSAGPTVIHGRTQSSPAMLQQTQFSTLPPPQHTRQRSCDLILEEQPLPPGWEMAKTPQGQIYFLNHVTQQTTWQDPRKPNFNINKSNVPLGQQTPPNVSPNVSLQNLHQLQGLQNMQLPEGWEQAVTPEGEMYFINHNERTTSWFDPRLPMHMQRLNVRPGSVHPQAPMGVGANPQQRGMQPVAQQQTALQKLQEEKEQLRKRQEELNRQVKLEQEMALRNSNTELTTITDPFLGQSNATDLHARQGSTDSGLGGMGSGTSFVPRTPEEFLSNVGEMDAQDGGHRQGDFNNMDMGSIDAEHSNMDSDDLVPSLQADDISNELLNDVQTVLESNKMDDSLLTWL